MPSPENPRAFSSGRGAPPTSAGVDLSHRADLVEMMDQPCSYEQLRGCLHDIARVNRLTFAYRPTISWMEELGSVLLQVGLGLGAVWAGDALVRAVWG